jgi:ubiquinone biosynthesis protein UbiJ
MNERVSPLEGLKPIAGRALEIALEQLLALDPETRAGLSALEGRRIELELEAPALALSIRVDDGRLRVGPPTREADPDLGVRATLGGLLAQLPFFRASASAPMGKLRINGDAELARSLQKLAKGFDPDWDQPFADALGPVFGPQVARLLREGLRSGQRVATNLARDAAEYVTEESRDVVAKAELDAFNDDVDALRDRAERLAARVARLAGPRGPAA